MIKIKIILDRDLMEESKYGFLDGSTNAGASKTSSFFLNKLVCDFTSVAAYSGECNVVNEY